MVQSLLQVGVSVACFTSVVHAAAPTVHMLDFPLSGECTEPTQIQLPPASTAEEEQNGGCSVLSLTGCTAALVGITAACGGPEDLPCIAAALSAISGCGLCLCELIGFKCGKYIDSQLPTIEYGTCIEAGYLLEQPKQEMKEGGFDVELLIYSKNEFTSVVNAAPRRRRTSQSVHMLDFPLSGECTEPLQQKLPQASTAEEEQNGGCSVLSLTGCTAALVGITVACGGPEDVPCIAAALSAISGCGLCLCQLIGFKCGKYIDSQFPTIEYGTCIEAGYLLEQPKQEMKEGGFDVELRIYSNEGVIV